MKTLFIAAAAAASMVSAAGAASASTAVYNLNVDTCTGTCGLSSGAPIGSSYGTVTVSGLGTDTLNFDVELNKAENVYFNQAGGPAELFSLSGPASVNVGSITPSSIFRATSLTGDESPGSYKGGGQLGNFGYEVLYHGGQTNNGDLPGPNGYQSLQFTVTGSSPMQLASGVKNGADTGIFFVADVYGANGKTGKIGAVFDHNVIPPSVPEPATWALMLLGVGGMGALLRRRQGPALA